MKQILLFLFCVASLSLFAQSKKVVNQKLKKDFKKTATNYKERMQYIDSVTVLSSAISNNLVKTIIPEFKKYDDEYRELYNLSINNYEKLEGLKQNPSSKITLDSLRSFAPKTKIEYSKTLLNSSSLICRYYDEVNLYDWEYQRKIKNQNQTIPRVIGEMNSTLRKNELKYNGYSLVFNEVNITKDSLEEIYLSYKENLPKL